MPRCILCKAITALASICRDYQQKQAWYEANKWKEGLAGVGHQAPKVSTPCVDSDQVTRTNKVIRNIYH
jgi:hypothetical protein